jgi:type IV pilus assembly protein PilC
MTEVNQPTAPLAFAYQAQTEQGQPVNGTIDAADAPQATRLLESLRLRVIEIAPVPRPPRPKALRGDDFIAFNQQLTHLTRAGLPIEHGLRLIAQDMSSGRLAETVRQVADDLDRGTPLDQAFEKRHGQFPPMYGRLVAAGVQTSNLPGMLLNLGRHMEMVYRLRAMLWRAASYPLMVMGALTLVLLFLGIYVIPKFEAIFRDFGVRLPGATLLVLDLARAAPAAAIVVLILVIVVPLAWVLLRRTGRDRSVSDWLLLPMPLVGSVLKRNLIARWCDAVRLGVDAGLDLPRAIALAGDAVGSPRLQHDSEDLVQAVQSGQRVDVLAGHTRLLPATIPTAMSLSIPNQDLAATLGTLSEMYQQQAETRLAILPALLTPALIVIVAVAIGFVVMALFLPFITLIQALSG